VWTRLRPFLPASEFENDGVCFHRANSQCLYFRLSSIVKIAKNAIFESEKADAQGSQHSRKDSLHSTFGPSLWCHDAAGHKLVGARIGEQKAADVDYVPIGDSRHSM